MNKISTQCGIWETSYRLIKHKNGSISVKAPFVRWKNNNGSLAFRNVLIKKFVDQALACFADEETEININEIVEINRGSY